MVVAGAMVVASVRLVDLQLLKKSGRCVWGLMAGGEGGGGGSGREAQWMWLTCGWWMSTRHVDRVAKCWTGGKTGGRSSPPLHRRLLKGELAKAATQAGYRQYKREQLLAPPHLTPLLFDPPHSCRRGLQDKLAKATTEAEYRQCEREQLLAPPRPTPPHPTPLLSFPLHLPTS